MSFATGSEPSEPDVHFGIWTNWEYGKIYGKTLTTNRETGAFLIAFLALFVSFASTSLWRIGCLLLHRYFSSRSPRDGLHNQRQAILRNATTATDGAWKFFTTFCAWRRERRLASSILIPNIVLALCFIALSSVAAIFSSKVIAPNEVLLSGSHCRILRNTDDITWQDPDAGRSVYHSYWTKTLQSYLNHATHCYMDRSNFENCQKYYSPRIPYSIDTNASCPFEDKICLSSSGNLVIDTGEIDSGSFGFNAPSSDAFSYRHVYRCAPLVTDGYMEGFAPPNTRDFFPSVPLARFFYGESVPLSIPNAKHPANGTFTYQVPLNFSMDSYRSFAAAPIDYSFG